MFLRRTRFMYARSLLRTPLPQGQSIVTLT